MLRFRAGRARKVGIHRPTWAKEAVYASRTAAANRDLAPDRAKGGVRPRWEAVAKGGPEGP